MFSRRTSSIIIAIAALVLCGLSIRTEAAVPPSVFVEGLSLPAKIAQTTLGNFVVTETLGGPNTGRVSIIFRDGRRQTLIDGLPSGIGPDGPSGPTGIDMPCPTQLLAARLVVQCIPRRLFVSIGEGDSLLPGPFPGTAVPNPNPSSPLLSSLLEIYLSERVERSTTGFTLTMAHQNILANGGLVVLDNGGGDWVSLRRVADFPNSVPNPLQAFLGNVRTSNPFALDANGTHVFIADGGLNAVLKVNILSGQWSILTSFPPRPNPTPIGPPMIEAVPAGIRLDQEHLFVTLFTGFPFVPGLSDVVWVDQTTGRYSAIIRGRSSAIDVLVSRLNGLLYNRGETEGRFLERFYVLEFSTNFLADEPGQLLRYLPTSFYSPNQLLPPPRLSGPGVVTGGLISPSGMVADAWSRNILITEIFTGRILMVEDVN